MKYLTNAECLSWIESNGVFYQPDRRLSFVTGLNATVRFEFPVKPTETIGMARTIARRYGESDLEYSGSLLWITDFGFWPEEFEIVANELIERLRRTDVSAPRLKEQPGTLFDKSELTAQQAALTVPLIIGWDAYYIPSHMEYLAFISHDEFIDITCASGTAKKLWDGIAASGPER